MNSDIYLALNMLKDQGFQATFTNAQEDAIIGHEGRVPNGAEVSDHWVERMLFFVEQHEMHWVACVSGLKQVIVVIHVSIDIINATRALIFFLKMRHSLQVYGSEIQYALWELQDSSCVTCFVSHTEIDVTSIEPSLLKPWDFMLRNPYEDIDLQSHRTWRIRLEGDHWLLYAGEGTLVSEFAKDADIIGIANAIITKL